ncbi:MAG: DUF5683 domain-containing protein [Fidelibacterota bacterium]
MIKNLPLPDSHEGVSLLSNGTLPIFCSWYLVLILFLFPIQSLAEPDTTLVNRSPAKAVLYSFIPGGGQIYNSNYLKAVLIMGAEVYSAYNFQQNRIKYNSTGKESYREDRNKYAWWMGFAYIYGLLDALVDSHLAAFDQRDPELDEEFEPPAGETEMEIEKE